MRTEFFRQAQRGHRVQIYVELRDLWIGLFVAPSAVYVVPFPAVVIRVTRSA